MSANAQPVFVFAPGAWHTPDCYQLVQDRLHAQGWETRAVAYPSVGAEPPTKSAFDDAAAVRAEAQALVDQGRQVVLVGHSYGGLVISEAAKDLAYKQRKAEGKEGGVVLLVYMSAFVVPKGFSLIQMLGGNPLPWMDIQGDRVYARTPEEIFYHDVPEDLTKAAVAKLQHQSGQVFRDEATYQAWEDIESMYFFCEDDRALLPAIQKQMAPMFGANGITWSTKGSHSPFLAEPDNVVEGLLHGAKEVQKRI
ncbi:hypothetical protein KVR01_005853 [Diaporthe batatas]|uniref:uncharacterized protein n=1 Tax=Diaporthe batatas TaxID=748121 RepID=UPI001D0513FD|nr:uncharacterized protein KVR01_005853 [Diaporthe batatas]KAG8163935.1 hypothetical protein KVR01_005853 [Diaporthe batatas]